MNYFDLAISYFFTKGMDRILGSSNVFRQFCIVLSTSYLRFQQLNNNLPENPFTWKYITDMVQRLSKAARIFDFTLSTRNFQEMLSVMFDHPITSSQCWQFITCFNAEVVKYVELRTFLLFQLHSVTDMQSYSLSTRQALPPGESLLQLPLAQNADTSKEFMRAFSQKYSNNAVYFCNLGPGNFNILQKHLHVLSQKKHIYAFAPDDTLNLVHGITITSSNSESIKVRLEHNCHLVFCEGALKTRITRIPRNSICPCGSGKKYKTCCGRS